MPTLELIIDSRKARQGQQEFVDSARKVDDAAKRTDNTLNKHQQTYDRTGEVAARTTGRIRALLGGLGGMFIARQATALIADFQQNISVLGAVSKASAEDLATLEARARELGATTRFTATESASALLTLARAGLTVNEVLAASGPVLDLAVAGVVSIDQAAETTVATVKQFGLSMAEAARIGDVLIATSDAATTDVTELAQAMKFAGPIAAALKVDLETAAAAVGILSNAGIRGAMAGTNLRMTMVSLANPTEQMQKVLRRYGITLDEVSIAQRGLIPVFERLKAANLSTADVIEGFSSRTATAVIALMNGVEALKEFVVRNNEAAGSARRNAIAISDNLRGALLSLRSAFEEVLLTAGDRGFAGVMRTLVDTLTQAFRALGSSAGATSQMTSAAIVTAGAIKALVITLAVLVGLKVAGFLINTATAMWGLVKATLALQLSTQTLIVLAAALVVAVGFVVTELALWTQEFEAGARAANELSTVVQIAFEDIKGAVMLAVEAIRAAWGGGMNSLKRDWALFVQSVWESIQSSPVLQRLLGVSREAADVAVSVSGAAARALDAQSAETLFKDAAARIKSQRDYAVSVIEATGDIIDRQITQDFGSRQREALSFGDFMLRDLEALKTGVLGMIEEFVRGSASVEAVVQEVDKAFAGLAKRAAEVDLEALGELMQQASQADFELAENVRQQVRTPQEVYAAEAANLDRLAKAGLITEQEYGAAVEKANKALLERSTNISAGIERFWDKYRSAALDAAAAVESVLSTALGGVENALAAIVTQTATAKEAFRDLGRAILAELTKIIVRLLIVIALEKLSSLLGGGAGGGSSTASLANTLGGSGPTSGGGILTPGAGPGAIPLAQHGGVFSGPRTGYPVMLHGTERVEPLDQVSREPLHGGSSARHVHYHNTRVEINALDAKTADQQVLASLGRNAEAFAEVTAEQLGRDPQKRRRAGIR